ncbi:hypothetical protein BGZ67_010390 [Mortierella alpina]|nr:hypothetical protein BGZ67_010390 [Mortierella alpina]
MLKDVPSEFMGQHHKMTISKSQPQHNSQNSSSFQNSHVDVFGTQTNHNQHTLSSSGFDYPLSGDESDNHHNQMEHLRSQFYTPDPQKRTKEYHIEQAHQAVELLKAAAGSTVGWKKVDKHKSGCMVYQSTSSATIPGHGEDKYPTFKGEHFIRGFHAQDVFSVVAVRKLWDDWYDELSCVEAYDDTTSLMYMVMKSSLSSRTRDVAMIERIQVEKDGSYYLAACSVESSKIPNMAGKVRAEIFLAGWIIQPLPSNPPITKITYVIQTDLLSKLPKFIAKRSLIKRALAITTIETHLRKNGTPITSMTSSQTRQRPRSSSEPIRLDQYLLPQDSEEDLTAAMAFAAQLLPIAPTQDLSNQSDAEDEDDILPMPPNQQQRQRQQHQEQHPPPTSSLAPSITTRDSLLSSASLFSQEFMDSNSFLGDETLFGDSPLFGKGGVFEQKKRVQDVESIVAKPLRPSQQQQKQQQPPQKQQQPQQRQMIDSEKPVIPEPVLRKAPNSKRASIPVVLPKSEARAKQYSDSSSSNNLSSGNLSSSGSSTSNTSQSSEEMQALKPPMATLMPIITPATPPLTPTASVDGRETTSDSDAAQSVKVVPRSPKTSSPTTSRPSSMAMSSFGMKSPSAMMEARRHSALMGRSSSAAAFVPRHSHVVPIRGNPNVSLQSLTRASGSNGTMTTAMKRHSTAPSIDSNRSLTAFTPVMVLPHRHSETARKALAMFKVLASSSEDRWRAISSESGFKSYSRIISGAGLPMLRGEGTITGGWTVEQINAVIESAGCRQVWDERFENLSIAETFNHNEYLFHITLRGVGSLTGRDLAGVTIIDRDPLTSALFNVSTSVLDPTIPEDPGRIRAMLELSGWSLRPTFDGQGNTVSVNVTFVIQIDIRGNLPSSVVKSMTASMTQAVSRLNQFINKSGYPPFASHISGTRLLDAFEPKTGFYELCYKAAPGWTEVRVGRKVYKEGYDFFIKPDDPSVRVELAPDFGGVRVWTTLDHEGQSIIAQVSRKGQNAIESSDTQEEERQEKSEGVKYELKDEDLIHDETEADRKELVQGRKRRSASCTIPSAQVTASSSFAASRPGSTASVASRASQGSEKSRARGRTPRQIVTLPAGTPPPPLPRRSSSLSRYSIPISPYLAGADAPPVPINTSAIAAAAAADRSSTVSALELQSASPRSASPVPSPVSASLPSLPSPTNARSAVESPLGSPTLGPFHVPHAIPTTAPIEEKVSKRASTGFVAPLGQMESISNVLADNSSPTTPVIESSAEASLIAAAAAVAISTPKAESEHAAAPSKVTEQLTPPPKERKNIEISSSLACQVSPTASPVPSPMMVFGARNSSLPMSPPSSTSTTSSTASAAAFVVAAVQPASSLKHSPSAMSLGHNAASKKRDVRVTFSLDTIDNSSDTTIDSDDDESLTARDAGRQLQRSASPLDKLMKFNGNNNNSHNSSSVHAPSMAKKHSVQVVSAHHLQHQTAVAEMHGSESEDSDEAEFVEARDELSDDEFGLALALAGVGSWPSSSSSVTTRKLNASEQKESEEELVVLSMQAVERGLRQLAATSSVQLKFGVVLLLLVYYAGRLSALIV